MKKILPLLLLVVVIVSGCSKYGHVSLKYPTAPQAFIPENIRTVAVVNRSLVKQVDESKAAGEALATGEVAGNDKVASDDCLRAVFDRLNGYKDLSIVTPAHSKFYGSGTRTIPEQLDWQQVTRVCDSSHADAMLVLEMFDSNSDLVADNVVTQVDAAIRGQKPPTPNTKVNMDVMSYWRLYDVANKKIIDQYQTSSRFSFDMVAQAANLPSGGMLKQSAYRLGEQYSDRFLPGSYYVRRELFKKGKGSEKAKFNAAFRKSEVADWEGASQIWMQLANSRNTTNAGRACLNVAVAYEVKGDSKKALEWAKKSYTEYGNKLARDYANALRNRMDLE